VALPSYISMREHSATNRRRAQQLKCGARNDTTVWARIALSLGVLLSTASFGQSINSTESGLTEQSTLVVAAASSFRAVWPSIEKAYLRLEPATDIRISFGSSGLLSTQIVHGAPFELFLSADKESVMRVQQADKTQGNPHPLVEGRLHVVSRLLKPVSLDVLKSALKNNERIKLAIANPRHAPYGRAARQALTAAGIWPLPRTHLLQAENASQALQFALSQAATLAIVPSALVQDLPANATVRELASEYQVPVVHFLAELKPAGSAAQRFSNWLKTPAALNVMQRFGLSKLDSINH